MTKWKIALLPYGMDNPEPLTLSAQGAVLTINGSLLDLSILSDGDMLPVGSVDHPLLRSAEVRCRGDLIEIDAVLFPVSLSQTDPAACFPEPIWITADGPVQLPPQFPSEPELEQQEQSNADQH